MVKELCCKATQPSCHPSQQQTGSSDFDTHLIHGI